MNLDDRLDSAVRELRDHLDHDPIPSFKPSRQVPLAGAAFAVLAALLVGAGLVVLIGGGGDAQRSEVVVAAPGPADSAGDTAAPDVETEPGATQQGSEPRAYLTPTQLTDAGPGEFIAPIPGVTAWSSDDRLLLLYRTGAALASHIVVDVETGETIAEPEVDAPDIEQVYWHPLAADQLLWLRGNNLMSHDVYAGTERALAQFDNCDAVRTGRFPSPPSASGAFHVLCSRDEAVSLVRLDLATAAATDLGPVAQPDQIDALRPSPSASRVALSRSDGSIEIIDTEADTRTRIELSGPNFAWVVLPDGTETLVMTSYDAALPGTMVLAPTSLGQPSGSDVLIGPDAGDEYPPSGTQLSATTDGQRSVAVATLRGPSVADSVLTGQVVITTIEMGAGSQPTASVSTFAHDGEFINEYWSTNTISINSAGTRLVWASDLGTTQTNTFIVDVAAVTAGTN